MKLLKTQKEFEDEWIFPGDIGDEPKSFPCYFIERSCHGEFFTIEDIDKLWRDIHNC